MVRRPSKKGLTLIELLLAVALFSVAGTILYSILSQGLGIWKRAEQDRETGSEEQIILKSLARKIRSGFAHSWVQFAGRADEIYFCGMKWPGFKDAPEISRLEKIHYHFQKDDEGGKSKGLYLSEYPIEQSFAETPPPEKLVTKIFKDLRFEYGYWDKQEKKMITKELWTKPKEVPKVIIIKATSNKEFTKTVVNPYGVLSEFEEAQDEFEEQEPGEDWVEPDQFKNQSFEPEPDEGYEDIETIEEE